MSIRKVVIIDEMTWAQLASEIARSVGYGFKLVRNENGASIGTYLEMIGTLAPCIDSAIDKLAGGVL